MDTLNSLTNQLSQVTMYDIKSMYNQAKNIVLNVSEMEAKVREATNDDAWGASSTLMQDIAQGTFNFQQFNEIMPCIYSRFMEKEASQWRQIYKALQLLEYIIKHGSERVVDDARSHLSTIKMLRNFHYIDEAGKDQGINVRNRSKELSELLQDLDRIRQERRKAKANRAKYIGTGNDGLSFGTGGSRYGGFGNDEYGGGGAGGGSSSGYGGGYDREYSGGGGGGGSRSGAFRDESGRQGYEEYDAGEDEDKSATTTAPTHKRGESLSRAGLGSVSAMPRRANAPAPSTRGSLNTKPVASSPAKPPPAKVMDLLGGFDEEEAPVVRSPPPPAVGIKHAPKASLDDDFDDFQSATPSPGPITAAPIAPKSASNVFDFLGSSSSQPLAATRTAPTGPSSGFALGASAPATQPKQTQSTFGGFASGAQAQQPMMGGGMAPLRAAAPPPMQPSRPNYTSGASSFGPVQTGAQQQTKPSTPYQTKPSAGGFEDLWSMGLGKTGSIASSKNGAAASGPAKSIRDLEKEKTQQAIWGLSSGSGGQQKPPVMGSGFGSFSGTGGGASGSGDDLLL
ncbi:Epsin-3, clathrin recruitment and traffic between the Golgi and endosome [Tulasnella sp. 330]|nr:Epsin-3, clathrin recruitment and traffic between the Golgi and endosome [Tulasnella sp. 330]KAG8878478.1 Epsin-3, clathrin recruitment and traffic between the Golgi and endosome [Tulasnella sp. 331]KAG8880165.1 Epsin-3, clathrin recruitment and traffic between the Golgi and endosome [Tulasnella sp. 332]